MSNENNKNGFELGVMLLRDFAAANEMFPLGTLRWWSFTDYKGFRSRVVRKLGRRCYLDIAEFTRWFHDAAE